MPTYDVTGSSSPALPLGELSPQVTERAVQPFSNDMVIVFPLRPRCALPPLPRGEAKMLARYHRYAQDAFSLLEHREPGCGAALAACPLHKYFRSIPNKKRTMTQLQSLRLQLPSDKAMSDSSGILTQNRECQGAPSHEAICMRSSGAGCARFVPLRLPVVGYRCGTIVSGKRKESLRTPESEARSAKDGERKRSF